MKSFAESLPRNSVKFGTVCPQVVAAQDGNGVDGETWVYSPAVRVDVALTESFSGFVMGGYQSDWDSAVGVNSYFANWEGDYALWAGLSAKLWEKATLNGQVGYEEYGNISASLNVRYKAIPGFDITPEITYTSYDDDRGDPIEGRLRLQRNF